MDTIDNLKKLGLKENRKYLALVIWLLINITLIQMPFEITINLFGFPIDLFDLIGIVTFLPFMAFLSFLLILSFFVKKDVKEIAAWKVLLYFFLTLPLMIIMILILVVIFFFSILSYIFFTSWFILNGAYLSSKSLDDTLKKRKQGTFFRVLSFIGGAVLAVTLLGGYLFGSSYIIELVGVDLSSRAIAITTYTVLYVGFFILLYLLVGIIFLGKKYFNAWLGIFSTLVVLYTFYLIIKVFLSLDDGVTTGDSTSPLTQGLMLIADLFIILYSISTLMGPKAQQLNDRIGSKRIGLDTILIWLVFSKVSYEFVHNFPYSYLSNFISSEFVQFLDSSIISLLKNILVLVCFLAILIVIGFNQMRKYNRSEKKLRSKVEEEFEDFLKPAPEAPEEPEIKIPETIIEPEPEYEPDLEDKTEFEPEIPSDKEESESLIEPEIEPVHESEPENDTEPGIEPEPEPESESANQDKDYSNY